MILFFISLYLSATIQEWIFHKYLLHTKTYNLIENMYKNHMLHHSNTMSDYRIKNDNSEYICFDFFSIDGIVQSVVIFYINTGFFYVFFHPNISVTIIHLSVAFMLFCNIFIWNTIHSHVHGFDASKICSPKGISNSNMLLLENNIIINWFIKNHQKHHDNKETNFNIVFPGADYLFGTRYYETKKI